MATAGKHETASGNRSSARGGSVREGGGPRKGSVSAERGDSGRKRGTGLKTHVALTPSAIALLIAIGSFLLLRGLAVMLHPAGVRLWGIDFAAWLGASPLWLLVLWLPVVFLFPPIAEMFRGTRSGSAPPTGSSAGRMTGALVMTLLAGALAWWIHVAYAFLGDGTWYAAELYRSMTLPAYANSMIKPSAWLTGIVLDGFARTFRPEDIRLPFIAAGVAGMLVAAGAVFFSTRRESTSDVLSAAVFLLGGAGTLVFLGYIELYALVYGLSVAYMITAWRSLRGTGSVWLPALLLVLAMLFGASAVVWLPSLLLLLHWKFRGEEGAFPLQRAAVILMLLPLAGIAVLYALGGGAGESAYLVALSPYERVVDGLHTGWQRYVFFAPQRWADIGSMLLLGLGAVAFILPVLLWSGRKEGLLRHPTILFSATAAAGGLTLLLFGNTFLGLARDWDVGAFALLGSALLAFSLWTLTPKTTRTAVMPVLTAAVLSQLILWTGLNTQEQPSAERFESIAAMDAGLLLPMNTFTAYENLRKFYQSGGETRAYFRVLRSQIETGYRAHIGYAEYLSSLLKLSDAALRREELSWLIDRYERAAAAHGAEDDFRTIPPRTAREFAARLLLSAWQIGERDLVHSAAASFGKLFTVWPEYGLLELLQTGTGSREDELSRIAAAVTPETEDPFLHMTAGGMYQQREAYERASDEYDTALEREPSLYPSWYLVAAELHFSFTGNREKARSILEAPESPEAARALQILQNR